MVGQVKRKTSLALRGIDTGAESSVVFRFAAGGQDYSWTFNAGTFDELVALGLSGRLGKGKDVHFDGAKVTLRKGRDGRRDEVVIAIGRKVKIVAPMPANDVAAPVRKRKRKAAAIAAE